MDLDFVSVHKYVKKELGQYPAILTEQTWSITLIRSKLLQLRAVLINDLSESSHVVKMQYDNLLFPVFGNHDETLFLRFDIFDKYSPKAT